MEATVNQDPTPEEITAECLRIQESWSPAEKRSRAPWLFHQSQVVIPDIVDMGLTQHLDSGE